MYPILERLKTALAGRREAPVSSPAVSGPPVPPASGEPVRPAPRPVSRGYTRPVRFDAMDTPEEIRLWAEETGCTVRGLVLVAVPETVETLTIPQGIMEIGVEACTRSFWRSDIPEGFTTALTRVELPEGLRILSMGAFQYCRRLEEIRIPDSVKAICSNTFAACSALKQIRFPEALETLEGAAFEGCTALEAVELPEELTVLSWGLFQNCTGLSAITLPSGLKEIRDRCFAGCTGLRELMLPQGLEQVGNRAFAGCTALEKINLPNRLKQLSRYCFQDCSSLTEVICREPTRYGRQLMDTPFWKVRYPDCDLGPRLPTDLPGVHSGACLRDRGYLFFDADREYCIALPDEYGLVEVSSWSGTSDPDEDGFGMEEEYDWWLLDENLEKIPGIPTWTGWSNRDMENNRDRWDEERRKAAEILRNR